MSQRAAKRLRVAYESLPHPPPAAARRPLPVRPAPQSVYAAPAEPVLTSTSSSEAAPAPLPLTSDRDEPIQAPPPKPRRPFSLLGPNAFWRRSPRSVEQLRYEAEERARKGKWYPEPIKYLPGVDEPPTKDRDLLFEVPEPGSFQEMWEGQCVRSPPPGSPLSDRCAGTSIRRSRTTCRAPRRCCSRAASTLPPRRRSSVQRCVDSRASRVALRLAAESKVFSGHLRPRPHWDVQAFVGPLGRQGLARHHLQPERGSSIRASLRWHSRVRFSVHV